MVFLHDSKKTVGYARVSTDEQISKNQVDKLRESGITIIFCDEGISGKRLALERPEYREMIKYLEQHPDIKTIAVYELSRLGRNMQDSINTVLNLEKSGYNIWSLTEEWTHTIDTNTRPLLIAFFSWMNEQELIRLSKRTKAGLDRARAQGKILGRPVKELDRETVTTLQNEGKSWKEISSIFRVDESTLFRYRQKWKRKDLGRD
jgi:putative DNA-invertase from lambdoid prophage Rac